MTAPQASTRPRGRRRGLTGNQVAALRSAATCGLLAVAGGRQGRRAAARGAVAAVIAVFGAQTVTRAVGVHRADIARMPGPRTMSAWAVAAGATLEMPRAGTPLGGLALGLSALEAWAQRSVASPVAGAVAGAAAAMVTRSWWPLGPLSAERVRRFHPEEKVDPLPKGEGLALVLNNAAGPRRSPSPAPELRRALPRAQVVEVARGSELVPALQRLPPGIAAIGIAGGDGSLNAGVQLAEGRDLPFVAVPAGTLNHFARDLGVPTVAEVVAAVERGEATRVDLGMIAGRPFLNQASVGGYVMLIDLRERLQRRLGKWPAAAIAFLWVLWRSEKMLIELDGELRRVWMVFIGNCHYVPNGLIPSMRQRLDDGVLDVRLLVAEEHLSRARLLFDAVTGRVERSPRFEQRLVRELRLRVVEPVDVRFGVDGETFDGSVNLAVGKRRESLLVLAPHAAPVVAGGEGGARCGRLSADRSG